MYSVLLLGTQDAARALTKWIEMLDYISCFPLHFFRALCASFVLWNRTEHNRGFSFCRLNVYSRLSYRQNYFRTFKFIAFFIPSNFFLLFGDENMGKVPKRKRLANGFTLRVISGLLLYLIILKRQSTLYKHSHSPNEWENTKLSHGSHLISLYSRSLWNCGIVLTPT